jgi:predicted AAA+ superfamily ATPase
MPERYAREGGFPEPLAKKIPSRDYCAVLFDAILYKDIVRDRHIRSVQGIGDLALHLLSNIGTQYSYGSLARAMQCSGMTVRKHISHFERAFLFFSIPQFSLKAREQAAANRKIYCILTMASSRQEPRWPRKTAVSCTEILLPSNFSGSNTKVVERSCSGRTISRKRWML